MNIETERKFLVRDDGFKVAAVKSYTILQGYIAHDSGNTVRVRLRDAQGFITIKGRSSANGLSRPEWEMEIPKEDAMELFKLCKKGRVEKTRYIVPAEDGLKWEVDEFYGDNEGLVLAEIELPSPRTPFFRPSWLGQEVTGQKNYYNSYLSVNPYTVWEEKPAKEV